MDPADRLTRGDLPPRVLTPPPGPRSREMSRDLRRHEAPGVNTLGGGKPSIVWREARGANVLDVDGNLYVDLTSGFGAAAVGHRHPRVVAAVREQSERLLHGLGDVHSHPARAELARRLAEVAPVDEPRVYFAASGSEAVEIAVKTALLATGRPGILAFEPAYHGLTLGALALTSRPEFRRPFIAYLHPHVHRLPFGCPLDRVASTLRLQPSIGCLILEPMVGREGVIPPPDGWLRDVAALCRERGVLFIADEIFTGFGRAGHWFAVQEEGVRPDLVCCGKALGGGLPIAATVGRRELMAAWETPGEALHTTTFLANPLSCAAALAVLEIVRDEALPERAAELGHTVGETLARWAAEYSAVEKMRGRGLLWAVLARSSDLAHAWVEAAAAAGVLALAGGPEGRAVQIAPPLTIVREQLEIALEILETTLEEVSPP